MVRARVDLGDLVAEAVAAARPALESAGLSVTTTITAGVRVVGDADRLHQVVGNLLSNTARYGRPGDKVTVSVARQGGRAEVVVADTGPGIPAEDLPRVFDRLWRGRADLDPTGSGIGLAVVRELVTAHGGVVSAASSPAGGSRFTVRLPLGQH
jgi:two-component system sensor histidine kinase BaeS